MITKNGAKADPEVIWNRYAWLRDNGHYDYLEKARLCEKFFFGSQWARGDLQKLRAQRRPALTINKILSTVATVLGEQIFMRTDTVFRAKGSGASADVAEALTKVYKHISDENRLDWVRSEVFEDGVLGGRGYFNVRLDFSDSLQGEVKIESVNPKNVLIDCDAEGYDPDTWNDVFLTKWLTKDDVALMYGKDKADAIGDEPGAYSPYALDALDNHRDRFGLPRAWGAAATIDRSPQSRCIRILERQWRTPARVDWFVRLDTGDMREVPEGWDKSRVAAYLDAARQSGVEMTVVPKKVMRIRWAVIAGNTVLHDAWSPFSHFSVVPFFPYFLRGRTMGIVEGLIDPQRLLNKTMSQMLHVVNTTANSGWIVKSGSLANMSTGELEEKGAETGLVLEVSSMEDAPQKIPPNQIPTGLDRLSYEAEEAIKNISGVSDYMQGFSREDVSAKSVVANQQSGQANLAKVMDSMKRTNSLLARNVLDIVQRYYTEPRLMLITQDDMTGAQEEVGVNQPTPEGKIVNDLTVGEYAVMISSQPEKDTYEDSQFDEALRLRTEAGVQIPDEVLIKASKLSDKMDIIQQLRQQQQNPADQLNQQLQQAQIQKLQADARQKVSDSQLRAAKAQQALSDAKHKASGSDSAEWELKLRKLEQDFSLAVQKLELDRQKAGAEIQAARDRDAQNAVLERQKMTLNAKVAREKAAQQAKSKGARNGR
jgi:hypothetical protein